MASLAQLAFVTAPATTPTITLNLLQPGLISVLRDSFSLGAPSFNGAPYSVGADYGERTVSFRLQVTGTYTEAMAALQLVSRQLTQTNPAHGNRSWLMFRWQPSSDPMFLQTFQSSLDPLDWEMSGAGIWELPVSVLCDAFIIGPPEDVSLTMTNDPSSGTNRMLYTFGTVKGDVSSPLLIATSGQGALDNAEMVVLGSHSLRGVTQGLLARDLSELTAGTDVGVVVTGGIANRYIDGNYRSCSFTTTAYATRLAGNFSTALTPLPGDYRVFVYVVVPSGGATTFTMSMDIAFAASSGGASRALSERITFNLERQAGTDMGYLLDMGLAAIPFGSSTLVPGLGAAPTSTPNPYVLVGASASAAVAVRFDELFLLPAQPNNYAVATSLAYLALPESYTGGNIVLIDGINESVNAAFDSSGTSPFTAVPTGPGAATASTGTYVGGLPQVVPGCNNYLTFMFVQATTGTIQLTTTFNIRYWPRYLHSRPDAD
jgi:hypothetical protein